MIKDGELSLEKIARYVPALSIEELREIEPKLYSWHKSIISIKIKYCFLWFVFNLGRNIKAPALWFLVGVLLSAIFQRYVPAEDFAELFGKSNEGFGVLMAATIGVPLYACGGGTIPLIREWLAMGMSMGSASAFMITGLIVNFVI